MINKIKVDLENSKLNNYNFTNKIFNIEETLKTTFSCLDLIDKSISIPLLAAVFTAPLKYLFKDVGIDFGNTVIIKGAKQSETLALIKAFSNNFGNFNISVPVNLNTNIEEAKDIAKKCKDVVVALDASNFVEDKKDFIKQENFINNIISFYTSNLANGMLLVASRIVPNLEKNVKSKVITIDTSNVSINKEQIIEMQNKYEELQFTMKNYIKFIIKNYANIKELILTVFNSKLEEAVKIMSFETAKSITAIYLGYVLLMKFATVAATAPETEENLDDAWKIFLNLGLKQNSEDEQKSLIDLITFAVEALVEDGKITVVDYDSIQFIKAEDLRKAGVIGFYSEKDKANLIYSSKLYDAIKNFYKTKDKEFLWSEADMCKALHENKYLYTTSKQDRPRITRNNPKTKKEETFLGILTDKMYIPCLINYKGTILTK